jgi:hypothetical protein
MRTLLIWLALSLSVAFPASGMELSRTDKDGLAVITVRGEIVPGDGERFVRYAMADKALIVLSSPGGDVVSAITMGEHIRMKGYMTFVPPNEICASACALTWLSGTVLLGTKTSKIGFHAAYSGNGVVTASGNALVGAYLNKIGASYKIVRFVTMPDPSDMSWLNYEKAKELGIEIVQLEMPSDKEPTGLGGPTEPGRAPSPQSSSATNTGSGDFRLSCTPLVREGRDPVVVISVSLIDSFWRIVHVAASGAQYDRGMQYRISRDSNQLSWSGQHRKKTDTNIVGMITKLNGKVYYNEKVIGAGELVADMTSKCEFD